SGSLSMVLDGNSSLYIFGAASTDQAVTFASFSDLVVAAALSSLSLHDALPISFVQIIGGSVTDASGLTIAGGAELEGFGTVSGPVSGSGHVLAYGGTLAFTGPVAAGLTYEIAPQQGPATLKFDGSAVATAASGI